MNRRNFLKVTVFTASLPLANALCKNLVNISSDGEFFPILYVKWQEHYGVSPEAYLESIEKNIACSASYKRRIKDDFFEGKTFEYEGLLLSKTEAAGLSTVLKLGRIVS